MTKFTLDVKRPYKTKIRDMSAGTIFEANDYYYMMTDEKDCDEWLAIDLANLGVVIHFDPDEEYRIFDAELILKIRG